VKKILLCIGLVLALSGMAFAADVGHGGGVYQPPLETPSRTVLDAVGGTPFERGGTVGVSSELLQNLQKRYGTSVVVLNIPSMTANASGVFVFGINLKNMVGKSLSLFYFYLNRDEVASNAVSAMGIPSGGYEYRDEDGRVITAVPDSGKVFVAVNVPKAGTYEPLIAVKTDGGGGGGGCNAGFSFAGLLSLGALFLLRKGK